MQCFVAIVVISIAFSASKVESVKSYKDYKVVKFFIENENQLIALQDLEVNQGVSLFHN